MVALRWCHPYKSTTLRLESALLDVEGASDECCLPTHARRGKGSTSERGLVGQWRVSGAQSYNWKHTRSEVAMYGGKDAITGPRCRGPWYGHSINVVDMVKLLIGVGGDHL